MSRKHAAFSIEKIARRHILMAAPCVKVHFDFWMKNFATSLHPRRRIATSRAVEKDAKPYPKYTWPPSSSWRVGGQIRMRAVCSSDAILRRCKGVSTHPFGIFQPLGGESASHDTPHLPHHLDIPSVRLRYTTVRWADADDKPDEIWFFGAPHAAWDFLYFFFLPHGKQTRRIVLIIGRRVFRVAFCLTATSPLLPVVMATTCGKHVCTRKSDRVPEDCRRFRPASGAWIMLTFGWKLGGV